MTSSAATLQTWTEVTTRFLSPTERPFTTDAQTLPLLVEAKEFRDLPSLHRFLREHSSDLLSMLHQYGGLLFRGFDVKSEADFESLILAIQGIEGMDGYFMMEDGRAAVEGARYVFSTNNNYKTGGTYELGGFHSENSSLTDVPAYISFWCRKPSQLGGETALMYSPGIYQRLPAFLRKSLEEKRFFARSFPLKDIATAYGKSESDMEDFLKAQGLEIGLEKNNKVLKIYKPGVTRHPVTGRLSLQGQLSAQIYDLDRRLRRHLVSHYRGLPWLLHRLHWSALALMNALPAAWFWMTNRKAGIGIPENIGLEFSASDVEALAAAIASETSVFTWKEGDVILADNMQVLHNGMPGRGDRSLRVMICNPLANEFPVKPGIHTPVLHKAGYKTIWQRLTR